jgi:hypothetical protein
VQRHHEGLAWVRGAEPLSAFDVVDSGPDRVVVRVLCGRLAVSDHRPGVFRVRWLRQGLSVRPSIDPLRTVGYRGDRHG